MKRYVKRISFLLAALMMVAVFAGCDNGEQTEGEKQESVFSEESVFMTETETEPGPLIERNDYK